MLKHKLEKIENEFNSKITQYDTKLKLISSTLKDLEHLNAHEVNTKLDRLETSSKSLVSAITKLRAPPKTTTVTLHNTAKTQITSNAGKNTLKPTSAHESSNIWRPMSFSENTSVTTSSASVGGASITDRCTTQQQNNVLLNGNSINHIEDDSSTYVDKQGSTGQQPTTTASSNSHTQQAAANSYMTNINNNLFGSQFGANVGTTTINNAGGPSANRYMYQPHILINQNPMTNSAHPRPSMPMTNMYRLPNQNLSQLINLGTEANFDNIFPPCAVDSNPVHRSANKTVPRR